MEKLETSNIEYWPESVFLGFATISENKSNHLLTEKENHEYESFTNSNRKAEFLAARHLFHWLLKELKISGQVELNKEEEGKPFALINGERLNVSFSHTSQKVFCAVSLSLDIGLDVEKVDRKISQAVVNRILNQEEKKTIGTEDPIRLWTIKEAGVKALGTGLRTNLNDLTILKTKKNSFSVRFNNEKMFEICSFRQLDHQIALAY